MSALSTGSSCRHCLTQSNNVSMYSSQLTLIYTNSLNRDYENTFTPMFWSVFAVLFSVVLRCLLLYPGENDFCRVLCKETPVTRSSITTVALALAIAA